MRAILKIRHQLATLTTTSALLFAFGATRVEAAESAKDDDVLRAQLSLDASAFKPGVIDGKWGEFTGKALARYMQSQGKSAPDFGDKPPVEFDLPLDRERPTKTTYQFTDEDVKQIGEVPEDHKKQEELDRLRYKDLLELAAEKFHATREFLEEINPGFDWKNGKAGSGVQVPNVETPFALQKPEDLKKQTEQAEKADKLKVEDDKPEAEQFKIQISVSDKILELHQGGKLVGSYPITPGSDSLPAPVGEWYVKGFSWMPTFRWDEAMLQKGERSGDAYNLPPGPNNPVGILWMELNKDGAGIHGTEVPETIGRTTSHGCIRLSNWDVLDLGTKVRPGVHVSIH